MRRRGFLVGCVLMALLQAGLVAGLIWFEDLSYWRAGVNHHVAYRKWQYNESVFTQENVTAMCVVLAALILALALLLVWLAWRRSARGCVLLCGWNILWAGVLIWELTSATYQAVRTFPYAVLGTAVGMGLSLLWCGISVCAELRRGGRQNTLQ